MMDQFFWDAVSSFVAPLFYALLDLSCTAVLLGLVVLLLRRVFDTKISPLWKNVLWLLVIFALVMPNFVESQASIRMDAPFTTGLEHRNQQQWELESTYNTYLYDVPDDERVSPTDAEEAETLSGVRIFWDGILPLFWLLGMVVMMGILLATRQKMLRRMRTTTGRPYDVLLADCKRQLNLTQTVEIVEQSYLKSPALWGLFRPKILLPDYVAEMSEDSRKYILLHELSHLKHYDLWKNTLLLALQVVYWFNPLVWLLFRFIRQDMELLNDERVLKTLEKSQVTPYAMSLIEVLGHANKLPLAPQMLCMVDNKENTKRRIQMIQLGEVFKKHRIAISLCCLTLIGVLSALFLTAQPEDATITPGTYVYANDAPDLSPIIFLDEDGTYTFTASLVTSFAFHGDYAVDGTTLKLTDETTVYDCQYAFQIVGDTLVMDLENSENPFWDIPDGAVFKPVDLDALLEDINQSETPPTATPDPDPWGITLTATDVTPTGMTLTLAGDGAEDVTGTLMTGSWFAIDVLENGTWTEVYAPRADWTEEGYPLPTTQEIDWEWIYGQLPSGQYRIRKEILNTREPGDFDRQIYTAEFEIPEQEMVGDPRLLTADELAYFNDNYFDILYDQEDYYVHFSEGTRMGNTVTLTFRGYEPDTGDVHEMIAEILTLEQVGDAYVFVSRDYAA